MPLPLRALVADPNVRRGARDMLDFVPGIGAWGLVTGVAMMKSGLSAPLALLMTLVVFSGSAQLAVLPLMAGGAPMLVIWAAAFCVNLRFVIFSAHWRVHFGHLPRWQRLALGYMAADLNLVVFQKAWPGARREPGQVAYFIGGAITIWFAWQSMSVLGMALSETIPERWGIGFAGTLAVLGMVFGLLKDRTTWLAALIAGCAAIAAYALPLRLNILVAIAAAVAAGMLIEHGGRALRGADQPPGGSA